MQEARSGGVVVVVFLCTKCLVKAPCLLCWVLKEFAFGTRSKPDNWQRKAQHMQKQNL